MSWHTSLVLGGIGSGRVEYAQSLLAESEQLRRLAPAGGLAELTQALTGSDPEESILVDDLAGWLPSGGQPADLTTAIEALAAAVASCPARLVLVSAEVGWSPPPTTAANRQLVTVLGQLNQAVATAADAVVLVIAGQPSWLRGGPAERVGGGPVAASAVAATSVAEPTRPAPDLSDLTGLPTPDEVAKVAAGQRLAGRGLGALTEVVRFAAACQGTATPAPWQQIRVLVMQGEHRASALRAGTDPLALLAAPLGANVQLVAAEPADAIEDGPAMPEAEVESTLGYGWRLAEQAADEGIDVLVLASIGDGAEAAAAAVAAALAAGTEPAGLLGRVHTPAGTIDDQAWMHQCAAVRDAVHRVRSTTRTGGRAILSELGGPDLAIATGVLLGAAARRTPVLLDGPVGLAAGLAARNLTPAARRWWLLPDAGAHPLVARVHEPLGLIPLLDLRLALGEGATALAALPLLLTGLSLANTLPALAPAPAAG